MSGMTLNVDDNLVKPVIEKEIQGAIARVLGNQEKFVEEAVRQVLNRKVDYQGKVSKYSHDNKYDFLDKHVEKAVQKAAKEAVQEWISDNSENIKKEIKKQLSSKKGISRFVDAMLDGATGAMSSNWRIQTSLHMESIQE